MNIIPKFMIAKGTLVRVLNHQDVTKHIYFKIVDGNSEARS